MPSSANPLKRYSTTLDGSQVQYNPAGENSSLLNKQGTTRRVGDVRRDLVKAERGFWGAGAVGGAQVRYRREK